MSKVKRSYQFSLHLPVAIHFPTVGKCHSHGATDLGESEFLGVSDWGVTDKWSHSLLETVSNQISGGDEIFYKNVCLVPRPSLFFFFLFCVLTELMQIEEPKTGETWERG